MNMKERLGCIKSPYDGRDYLLHSFLRAKELPEKVDLTDEMTPVRNQGNEGCCVGFAGAVGVKEWMEQKDYSKYVPLSPRYLYEEARKIDGLSHSGEGTTLVAAAKVLVKQGVCEERFWPYEAHKRETYIVGVYQNADKFKIKSGWARATTEQEIKGYLNEYGCLLAGVAVYRNWDYEENGHIPDTRFGIGYQGGHAICLVGYDDKAREYKFKNSWGVEWGNKGYGYLTYQYMKFALLDVIGMVDIDDPDHSL